MTATESVGNGKGQNLAKVSHLPTASLESPGKTRTSLSFRSLASRRGQLLPTKAGGGVKVMITILNLFCYRHETVVCLCLTSLCTANLRMPGYEVQGELWEVLSCFQFVFRWHVRRRKRVIQPGQLHMTLASSCIPRCTSLSSANGRNQCRRHFQFCVCRPLPCRRMVSGATGEQWNELSRPEVNLCF